jgi:putative ABC transport system permease protein
LLLSVNKDAGANFEESIYNCLNNYLQNKEIKIERMSDLRIKRNKMILIPIVILLIIAGFLIFNVALGLFGVLWFNINKRKSEIALRMAIGASKDEVMKQIVAEAMVITTFSLIIGSFIALQFPLLNLFNILTETYLYSFVLSLVFIYLIILACAIYPGYQAAKIYPANALHED